MASIKNIYRIDVPTTINDNWLPLFKCGRKITDCTAGEESQCSSDLQSSWCRLDDSTVQKNISKIFTVSPQSWTLLSALSAVWISILPHLQWNSAGWRKGPTWSKCRDAAACFFFLLWTHIMDWQNISFQLSVVQDLFSTKPESCLEGSHLNVSGAVNTDWTDVLPSAEETVK